MTVGFVGVHYPHPTHFDDFITRVHHAVDVLRTTPGCLSAACWVTGEGDAVVSTAQFASDEALAASFAVAQEAGVDFSYDERERLPRQVLTLRPAVAPADEEPVTMPATG
ncbi:antibiotic biosynthesis monooxygenase [Streptomyces angustmyceticus]|uniref:antibiotic biosynthesis monooxygenase n=1 Tax=Streptomyces angustmyceticus TaxID=285578 RepID=UPI003D94EA84